MQIAGSVSPAVNAGIDIGGGLVGVVAAALFFEVARVIVSAVFAGKPLLASPGLNQGAAHAEVLAQELVVLVGLR